MLRTHHPVHSFPKRVRTRPGAAARPRRQRGASLIEVLVTFLLLSFGLLALGSMQALTVSATSSASNRAVAASLASEFSEMMRANPGGFSAGSYDKALNFNPLAAAVTEVSSTDRCNYPACTPATLATFDAKSFEARIKASLRAGTYAVVRPSTGGVTSTNQADLWIVWPEAQTFTDRTSDASGSDTGSREKTFDNCPASVRNNLPLPRCFYLRVTL
jgi:type IV pilus assembly protein PilV